MMSTIYLSTDFLELKLLISHYYKQVIHISLSVFRYVYRYEDIFSLYFLLFFD